MWLLDELEKRKHSDDIAIRYMDEYITFKEMWRRSECMAGYLYANGLNKNPLVIYGGKEIDIVPCMHAALKVGIPYVPVDTLYPINRLKKIANAVAANVVIDFSEDIEKTDNVLNASDLKLIHEEHNFGGWKEING